MENRDVASNLEFFSGPMRATQLSEAMKGIMNPTEKLIHPSKYKYLYRIGHSTNENSAQKDRNFTSPWWLDWDAYNTVLRYQTNNSISLTLASRVMNAQTTDHGVADRLIKVELLKPVLAFVGVGKMMKDSKGRSYAPSTSYSQMFIPGLGKINISSGKPMHEDCMHKHPVTEIAPGKINPTGW